VRDWTCSPISAHAGFDNKVMSESRTVSSCVLSPTSSVKPPRDLIDPLAVEDPKDDLFGTSVPQLVLASLGSLSISIPSLDNSPINSALLPSAESTRSSVGRGLSSAMSLHLGMKPLALRCLKDSRVTEAMLSHQKMNCSRN